MLTKRKVLVAITARPSYSRIRTTLQALAQQPNVSLQCLCSGAALSDVHGRVADLIRQDGFTVADECVTLVPGNEPRHMAYTTARTVEQTTTYLEQYRPDWVVTIADRYETLGTAVAAAYMGIPLIHVQGGEITGNIDERVRHAVTKLSDIHLVANQQAANRLMRMGEHPDRIFVTGCPSVDLARAARELPLAHVEEAIRSGAQGHSINLQEDFIVVLQHADTTEHQSSYQHMRLTLESVRRTGLPYFIFNPNSDAGSAAVTRAVEDFLEEGKAGVCCRVNNLEGKLFLRLLAQSRCLVGNSSVGIRECAFLGTPVVNLGDRQRGRERGDNVYDCSWDAKALAQALRKQIQRSYGGSQIYGSGYSGELMADIIAHLPEPTAKCFHEAGEE
ncbi:MAG: UDP-N-acetylglucosamine 2-epimerase (hydrolyzing) [Ferrovum sp.]|nr:UDP-N-acetylglucosamine 2-epimerase (hydrolyzing) [Ferrovum sp.]NDU86575.1 UDP-N-acetylglucosamine 2-epimerase (hydrolyzing) [Ferrovum sp.]